MEFIQIGGAWAFLGLAAILALYMLKRRFEEELTHGFTTDGIAGNQRFPGGV